jgi:DNA topoisomerase VI subunit B
MEILHRKDEFQQFLHDQMLNIGKAAAYDIISKQVVELTKEKEQLLAYKEAVDSIVDQFSKMDIEHVAKNPIDFICSINQICLKAIKQQINETTKKP